MAGEQLTTHFNRQEFRCKCGCGADYVDIELVEALEELRCLLGAPIYIASGVRCPSYNKYVGSKPSSLHVAGKAADICLFTLVNPHLLDLLGGVLRVSAFVDGGVGLYPTKRYIHVDIRKGHARWIGH